MPSVNATSGHIREHFKSQGAACTNLGSPFTGRLCAVLAELLTQDTAFGAQVLGWQVDPRADALALRVCGGLQALSWENAELAALYPPHQVADDEFAQRLGAWLHEHDSALIPWLDSAPQTNEVSRSGVLLGGLLHLADNVEIELLEIGSSAGLNLFPDCYAYDLGEGRSWGDGPVRIVTPWTGNLPPLDRPLRVVSRAGCDIAPIDLSDPAARMRLRAYVWPDQTARIARFEAAVAHATAAKPDIAQQGAAEFLEQRLADPVPQGRLRVIQHSIMWQYMPLAEQERAEAAIRAAGARDGARLAWLRLEADAQTGTAAILLTHFGQGETVELGRGDFHGRSAHWT